MLFQELYPGLSTLRTIKQPIGEIELYIRVERHLSGPLFTLQVCQSVLSSSFLHDWLIRGWQNYVAYGCQNSVVVVDPQTVQVVQTLTNGTANITKVRTHCYVDMGSAPCVPILYHVNIYVHIHIRT